MAGLGALYSRASSYIFGDWNKCGELMGLAPYGRPDRVKPLMEMKDGRTGRSGMDRGIQGAVLIDSGKDWEKSPSMQHWKDLAWRVQDDTEKVLLARARWLRETTGAKNLCIAGGVALNCVANGRIVREAGFDNVWIQPAAGDDGIAIGCALYGHLALQKKPRKYVMGNAYFGGTTAKRKSRQATSQRLVRHGDDVHAQRGRVRRHRQNPVRGQRHRLVPGPFRIRTARARQSQHHRRPPQGGDEGHPEQAREASPGIPAVCADHPGGARQRRVRGRPRIAVHAGRHAVRPEWRDKMPAIVHVDGTARVQTVRREENERLYQLLKEFEALTGVPVLLNTSFNVKGEPIVETPR